MSNIDMECPLCHAELEIPVEFEGKKVKCPSCSKIIMVVDPRIAQECAPKTFKVNRGAMENYTPSPVLQQKRGGLPVPVIIGLVLMMVITIGVSITAIVVVNADSENKSKASTEKVSPTLTDNKSPLQKVPEPIKTGKLIVYATYKYNDFVGNKPDTGAMVMLRPVNCTLKPEISILGLGAATFKYTSTQEALKTSGIYVSEVNGFGKAIFNKLPSGEYVCIIQSNNTRSRSCAETTGSILSRYFEGDSKKAAEMAKFHTENLKVEAGEEQEISHDFWISD